MQYIDRKKVKWVKRRGYTAQIFLDFKEPGNSSRFVLVRMEPHAEIKTHYHAKIKEILYFTKGRCKIIVNGVKREFKPEDIILLEPKEVHSMINGSDEPIEWIEFKMHDPRERDIVFLDE